MIHQLIHVNYATILLVLFLMVFLCSNTVFKKHVTSLFLCSCFCVMILLIADSIETWTESLDHPTKLRIIVSAIGYSVRPLCILNITLIVMRSHKINRLLYIPFVINGLVSFSALYTDIAFSYSADNQFVRGPLGITAYVTSGIYLILLFIFTVRYMKERHIYESMISFAIFFVAIFSIFLEVAYKFDGFINATFAVSITFYYLLFHAQMTKRDPLTKAFNRRCFYDDADRNFAKIKAIISIDLNDLKKLNDNNGHASGDTALCTVVNVIKAVLPYGCTLYRTGGDEFMIMCLRYEQPELEELISKMRAEIAKTPYTCAFGLAMMSQEDYLDSICAKADALMYEDKIRIKGAAR